MKRLLPLAMFLMTGALVAPANADIVHRLSTSTALTVDAAASQSTRLGSTYSVSGNNIQTESTTANNATTYADMPSLTAISAGVTDNGETTYNVTNAAPQSQGTWEMTTPGDAFSFTESFTLGDQVSSGTSVTIEQGSDVTNSTVVGYNVVETLPAFGQTTTTAGGVAGSLAGTITSAGAIGLTAGGAGTTATGQFVSEVTIR